MEPIHAHFHDVIYSSESDTSPHNGLCHHYAMEEKPNVHTRTPRSGIFQKELQDSGAAHCRLCTAVESERTTRHRRDRITIEDDKLPFIVGLLLQLR